MKDSKPRPSNSTESKFTSWLPSKTWSIGLFALAFIGMTVGFLPGWVTGLSLIPLLLSYLGQKRGLIASASIAALFLPAFQPAWALVIAPACAIAFGIAGWRYHEGKLWRVAGFVGGFIGYLLALALFTEVIIPVMQPAAFWLFGHAPNVLMPLAVLSASGYIMWQFGFKNKGSRFMSWGTNILGLTGIAASALLAVLNLTPSGYALQLRWSMKPEVLSQLPHTVNNRILPRETAAAYHKDANIDNGYITEEPHIMMDGNNLWWQTPVHNQRWYGRILGSVAGVLRVDADKTDRSKEATGSSSFLLGNNSWVVQSAFRARHFLSEMAEVSYYRQQDQSWVMLISYISQRPYWTGAMRPYLAGVMVIDQNGFISDLSVSEAAAKYPGAVFYPPKLARMYAEAYGQWRMGFFKTKVGQFGMMEISEDNLKDPGFNPQPYVTNFKDIGLQEVVIFEPIGAHQSAMVEALMFDAATGKMRSYRVPETISLSGPRRCIQQVRSSDTQTDWSHRRTVEPRLAISSKGVFFLSTITTKEPENPHAQNYITSVICNSSTLHSQRFQTADEIRKFLEQ